MTYNINNNATVILTKAGADILNNISNKQYQKGDSYSNSLWEIMHIFGNYLEMGCNIPFDKNAITIEHE